MSSGFVELALDAVENGAVSHEARNRVVDNMTMVAVSPFIVEVTLFGSVILHKNPIRCTTIIRKSGQSFSVGDATITLQIENGQIRVVIDAPKDVEVVRSELLKDNPS